MSCRSALVFRSRNLSHQNIPIHKLSMALDLWNLTTVQSINYIWFNNSRYLLIPLDCQPISPQSSLMPSNLMQLSASHNGCLWNSSFTKFGTILPSHIVSPKSFSGSPWRNKIILGECLWKNFSSFPPRHKLLCWYFTNDHFTKKSYCIKISFVRGETYACTKVIWDTFLRQPFLFKIKNILYMYILTRN